MSKRRAVESLEEVSAIDSPASKKVRVEDALDEDLGEVRARRTNGNGTNGHLMEPRKFDGEQDDILGADREIHEEMREVGLAAPLDNGEDDIDEEDERPVAKKQAAPAAGYGDLYLDTINRSVLDFDFEKLCSVTLSNINVYACLVCGKYYQGRGTTSQAYFHALEEDHHVFINMETKKVYVLPEGYEVKSNSLEDIKFVVDPRLPKEDIAKLDKTQQQAWDLLGRRYVPGFVGMNNIKANDYVNVVVHALAHVTPLRNYFMMEDLSSRKALAQRFSTLTRKIWNPRNFKSHVSPHEILQEITLRSTKRFTMVEQADPVDFMSWFLNNLHLALGGSKTKPGTSIVQKVFQGQMQVESQVITARADASDRLRFEDADTQLQNPNYLILTLDLPPAPLFQNDIDRAMIPQVPLREILTKYDGVHAQEHQNHRRRHRLLHPLPPYLIFHIKRFTTNKFVSERNPTIVTFTPNSLDMSQYVRPDPKLHPAGEPILYDLIANVTLEATRMKDDSVTVDADKRSWRIQLRDKSRDEWYDVQDLDVKKVDIETLHTKEAYLQIWERRRTPAKSKGKAKS